jgi:hypothetical protein
MKLIGWTIVLAGLVVGIAACTVETTDSSSSDGGTGGSGGGTAGAGGAAAGAAGSVAGAAGEAGAAGTAGAAGGTQQCTVEDADAAGACDLCAAEKCCDVWLACEDDVATPPAITVTCKAVYDCAATCFEAGEAGDYLTCLQGCDSEANPKVTDLYECLYDADNGKCANECGE